MKRVRDTGGVVHFCGSRDGVTLCGLVNSDLFHAPTPFAATSERVTCPDCAKLYCRVKNAPWNEVEDEAMDRAMYDAVKPDGETTENEGGEV